MINDITLGQYYACNSIVHRLDPRTKIRFVIAYIFLLIWDSNIPMFATMTGILFITLIIAKIPVRYILKGTGGLFVFILVCSAINIFTTHGTAIVEIGFIKITVEGIIKCGYSVWRLALMVIMASMLMYTTTPSRLTDGLEKGFLLNANVAMAITIGLRFMPVLFEELDRIIKAQTVRGANIKTAKLKEKITIVKNIIIPLFQNAINRASKIGEAMDARCYTGGNGRTKLYPLKYSPADLVIHLLCLCMIVGEIVLIVKY